MEETCCWRNDGWSWCGLYIVGQSCWHNPLPCPCYPSSSRGGCASGGGSGAFRVPGMMSRPFGMTCRLALPGESGVNGRRIWTRNSRPVGGGKRSAETPHSAQQSLCLAHGLAIPCLSPCPALARTPAETRTGSLRGAYEGEGACASRQRRHCDMGGNQGEEEEGTQAALGGTLWGLEEEPHEAHRNSEI